MTFKEAWPYQFTELEQKAILIIFNKKQALSTLDILNEVVFSEVFNNKAGLSLSKDTIQKIKQGKIWEWAFENSGKDDDARAVLVLFAHLEAPKPKTVERFYLNARAFRFFTLLLKDVFYIPTYDSLNRVLTGLEKDKFIGSRKVGATKKLRVWFLSSEVTGFLGGQGEGEARK